MITIRISNASITPYFQFPPEAFDRLGPVYLDLQTGDVVPHQAAPADELGDGRPPVQGGKRYVRVPLLKELADAMPLDEAHLLFEGHPEVQAVLRQMKAAELAALRWLASIRPQVRIDYFDGLDRGPTLYVYEPEAAKWRHQPRSS